MPLHAPDDRASLLLEDRVKRVFRELPGAVAGQEEPVHQVRVAGRRLRVALPLLARKGGSRPVTHAVKVLRQLTRAVGEGRDMDVILGLFEQASLVYCTANFSPFQFRQLRILEFPAYETFAQSFANTIPYSEGIGFIADSPDPDKTDMATYVTAHEVAHQWFGGQVSNVSDLHYWWVESLSEVSSAFYAQARQDDNALRGTLASWRNRAFNEDWKVSLLDDINYLRVEPGTYGTSLRYTKGPYVFWMLKEYFGEQKVIQFLRNMVQWRAGDLCSTSDVQDVAERTFGQNMDWFFDQYIRDARHSGSALPVRLAAARGGRAGLGHHRQADPADDGQGLAGPGQGLQEPARADHGPHGQRPAEL